MNQKGFANIILVVVIVILLGVVGYFAFVKKSEPIAQQPAPTPTQSKTPISPTPAQKDEIANWKTYNNTQYSFSFKYPTNIFAYNAVDNTSGQIPDVAGFGYTKPGQYDVGNPLPADKMGLARILVWNNVSQDLKSWLKIHEPNIKSWTDTQIGGVAALVNYLKVTTATEGIPMTFKTYYFKTGNKIIGIMGFSETNQYSDNWIVNFDKIIATFKFTN